jgi:prophage maintenance system killer protein
MYLHLCSREYKVEKSMSQEIKNKGEIVIYQTPDGVAELDVRLEKDTVWLAQAQMVALFQRDRIIEWHPFMDGNHRIVSLLYRTFK